MGQIWDFLKISFSTFWLICSIWGQSDPLWAQIWYTWLTTRQTTDTHLEESRESHCSYLYWCQADRYSCWSRRYDHVQISQIFHYAAFSFPIHVIGYEYQVMITHTIAGWYMGKKIIVDTILLLLFLLVPLFIFALFLQMLLASVILISLPGI